jgi:hypothetical protein
MRFEQKLTAAIALLESTSILRDSYAPPLFRLLWRLGFRVPPPHFLDFTTNFVFASSFFSVMWGFLMWLAEWPRQGLSLGIAGSAISAGLLFGLGMAGYDRYVARKYRIPLWRDFRPTEED